MVRILSRGTSTDLILLRKASTWDAPRRCGAMLQPLSPIAFSTEAMSYLGCFSHIRGFYFGPHHLIMASLVHFDEKVHRKKLQRADTIPLLFSGCFARSWSIWVFLLSLSTSAAAFVKSDSLLTNGISCTYRVGRASDRDYTTAPTSPTSAPPMPMPRCVSTTPPLTPTVPSVAPTTSKPSITISASEFWPLKLAYYYTSPNPTALGSSASTQPDLPASLEPLAPVEDTIPVEDTTTADVKILPPQEATINAIASIDPQDEPHTVDTVTTT
ncbi:hypothetical protein CK203_115616, partial [Vitis vinifera]